MQLVIQGAQKLVGSVQLSGAKNSALKLLAASLLTPETVVLDNFPSDLLDVEIHIGMLKELGKIVTLASADTIQISESKLQYRLEWTGQSIRNTLLMLGALVARLGIASVPLPGGCKLGDRKYDLHVMLLERLGARVWEDDGYLFAEAKKGLIGSEIHLPIRSTGATENAILAGCLAKGITRIWNPHIRPEILDLIELLKKMGAKIRVFGQEHIEVSGSSSLHGAEHTVIPDNMEAITWLVGAVITNGDVEIKNFPYNDLEVVLAHLKAAGALLYHGEDSLIVRGGACYPLEFSTGPHPGINSDVQPILAAWAACANGESRITDLRFPGRYGYASEMENLGIRSELSGDILKIYGDRRGIFGGTVRAIDLRAGAALSLCSLVAEGETTITDAWQITRGYSKFVDKLLLLGASAKIED